MKRVAYIAVITLTLLLWTNSAAAQDLTAQDSNEDGFIKIIISNESIRLNFGKGVFTLFITLDKANVNEVKDVGRIDPQGGISVRSPGCPFVGISPTTLTNLTFGTSFSMTLKGNGGVEPYSFELMEGDLPTGVSLAGDGTLSGTPRTAGRFFFRVKVTDANSCSGEQDFTLGVGCPTITITGPDNINIVVGNPVNLNFSGEGGTGVFTFSTNGGLPPGVNLSSDGTLSGTPTQIGVFNFTVIATDTNNCASGGLRVRFTVE